MKLWIFGDSLSLPYHIDNESQGWPALLAQRLGCGFENFSKPAADNFFIYSSYNNMLSSIGSNDIVVIGWSHYSRKSFVLDHSNPNHTAVLDSSFVYQSSVEHIRSKNQLNDTVSKWTSLRPVPRNKPFYDTWFRDYYSVHEQKSNLYAYHNAVSVTCPGNYAAFFFSQECINDIPITDHAGCMLEFIVSNHCAISEQDSHLNETGHKLWADILFDYLEKQREKIIFPIIELVDRYTIAKLKFSKTQSNLAELNFYTHSLSNYNLDSVSDDIEALYQIHAQIWSLESELKTGKENNLSLDELGRRAIAIRNHNHQRIALKNKIAETLGDVVREIKQDHLSQ